MQIGGVYVPLPIYNLTLNNFRVAEVLGSWSGESASVQQLDSGRQPLFVYVLSNKQLEQNLVKNTNGIMNFFQTKWKNIRRCARASLWFCLELRNQVPGFLS